MPVSRQRGQGTNLKPQNEGSFIVRLLACALLATIALISGCGGDQVLTAPPEHATLKATPDPTVAYIAIIGDTYTSGSSFGGQWPNSWPARATALLQEQGIKIVPIVGAKDGSGYFHHSEEGGVRFVDQVREVVGTQDQLVILFGSLNDRATLPDELNALGIYVQRTLAGVKKKAPKAKLLVIGPAWGLSPNPPPGVLEARDAIRAQAEGFGAIFVDPIAEAWFADHPEMLSSHGGRVNDAGHQYMAEKIAPLIAQQLQAQPAP